MIKIGYAGSLAGYSDTSVKMEKKKPLFTTYRNNFFLSSTRSGYFFFKGLEILKKEYHFSEKEIQVHFWGNIHPLNKEQIKEFGIQDIVTIEGYKSKKETQELLASFDILFLPLELNSKDHQTLFIPGKVFEYLSMRKPILLLSEESDCKEIVQKSNLGIFANPIDPQNIADKLKKIIEDKSLLLNLQPNESYIQSCSFKQMTKQIASVFDSLVR